MKHSISGFKIFWGRHFEYGRGLQSFLPFPGVSGSSGSSGDSSQSHQSGNLWKPMETWCMCQPDSNMCKPRHELRSKCCRQISEKNYMVKYVLKYAMAMSVKSWSLVVWASSLSALEAVDMKVLSSWIWLMTWRRRCSLDHVGFHIYCSNMSVIDVIDVFVFYSPFFVTCEFCEVLWGLLRSLFV